jgi:ABC-type transport system involved in cytochrome c biogenesis permease component
MHKTDRNNQKQYICRLIEIMTSTARIGELLITDIKAEFRNLPSVASVLLFSTISVFIAVKSISEWTLLLAGSVLWILLLFSSLNVSSGTFNKESGNQKLFYYTLYNPGELIIAKIIFNTFYIFLVFLLSYFLFVIFTDIKVNQLLLYFYSSLLASLGLSTINAFSVLISGSTAAQNTNLLLSIMALPIAIPLLLTMINITKRLHNKDQISSVYNDILLLGATDLLMIGVVIFLIRQLWTA